MLDPNVTVGLRIKALCKSWFYHVCSFRQSRSSLDYAMAACVALALVSLRLYQMNSVLHDTALKHTVGLQQVQSHAELVLSSSTILFQCTPPAASLVQLEWLIQFRLITVTCKALHTGCPPYLTDLLQCHQPMKSLCSSSFVIHFAT